MHKVFTQIAPATGSCGHLGGGIRLCLAAKQGRLLA
jgi:hypothetical protein